MNKLIPLLIFTFSVHLMAQPESPGGQLDADISFNNGNFKTAEEQYQFILGLDPTDAHAHYWLGQTLATKFRYDEAREHFQFLIENELEEYPLALFYYARMQKMTGNYSEAIRKYVEFIDLPEEIKRGEIRNYTRYEDLARLERAGCEYAKVQITRPTRNFEFQMLPAPIRSDFNDYAVAILENDTTIAFSSSRPTARGLQFDPNTGEAFADIFQYNLSDEGGWKEINSKKNDFSIVNTGYTDLVGAFTNDGNTFYYTSTYVDNNGNGKNYIYVMEKKGGKWGEPELLNRLINHPSFEARHPALTPGGDTLFFSSNRPRGYGGYDIWMSVSNGRGGWGTPINLGQEINTPENEATPFYDPKNKILFFSSNGHIGFGGMDIYHTTSNDFDSTSIVSLGLPFNSSKDDLFPVLGKKYGYISSNRSGTQGIFNIYKFLIEAKDGVVASMSAQQEKTQLVTTGLNQDDIYYFERLPTEDKTRVNSIINQIIQAGGDLNDVDLGLEDKLYFNKLSSEERATLGRMANALMVNNLQVEDMTALVSSEEDVDDLYVINDIYNRDQYYYERLPSEERSKVDRIIGLAIRNNGIVDQTRLDSELKAYFESLSTEEQETVLRLAKIQSASVDRLITQRMFDADFNMMLDELIIEARKILEEDKEFLQTLPSYQRERLEQFVVLKLYQQKMWDDTKLQSVSQIFTRLPSEQVTRLERTADLRENSLRIYQDDPTLQNKIQLISEDRLFLQKLSSEERKKYDRLIRARTLAMSLRENQLIQEDAQYYYENLDSEAKLRIDRLSQYQVSGILVLKDGNLEINGDSFAALTDARRQQVNDDKMYYNLLPSEEKIFINSVMVAFAGDKLLNLQIELSADKQMYFENLPTEQKENINSLLDYQLKGLIVKDGSSLRIATLGFDSEEDKNRAQELVNTFNRLPSEERLMINTLISEVVRTNEQYREIFMETSDQVQFTALPVEAVLRINRLSNGISSGNIRLSDDGSLQLNFGDNVNDAVKAQLEADLLAMEQLPTEQRSFTLNASRKLADFRQRPAQIQLSDDEKIFFENLPVEEKLRINRLAEVSFSTKKMEDFYGNSLLEMAFDKEKQALFQQYQEADQAFLDQLPSDQRAIIESIIEKKLDVYFSGGILKLTASEESFLEQLPSESRERIDRIAERRLFEIRGLNDNTVIMGGESLTSDESALLAIAFDRTKQDQDFLSRLPSEEKELIEQIILYRMKQQRLGQGGELTEEAELYLQNLPSQDRDRIERLVEGRLRALDVVLNDPDLIKQKGKSQAEIFGEANEILAELEYQYYQLDSEEKMLIDQMVTLRLKDNTISDYSQLPGDAGYEFQNLRSRDQTTFRNIADMMGSKTLAIRDNTRLMGMGDEGGSSELAKINSYDVGGFDFINISGKLVDDYSGKPAGSVLIPLINKNGEIIKTTRTESDGTFKYNQLPTNEQYSIQIDSVAFSLASTNNYRILDLKVTGSNNEPIVSVFDNIYFDVNKSAIRPEAKQVLDDLVVYFKKNPGIQIEVTAYADTTSTAAYNLALSRRRGNAVLDYLVKNGVNQSSVIINAMGRMKTPDTENVNYGLQMSRRVEFEIVGAKESYNSPYQTYLTRPGATISKISAASGVSEDELRRLNGIPSGEPDAFKPFRINEEITGLEDYLFSIDEYIKQ